GCGRGSTTLTAARRVGGSGLVLGVDACLTMLEDARRRVAAAALRHVGFVHGDAQTQRFAPLRFDVIVIAGGLSVLRTPTPASPASGTGCSGAARSGWRRPTITNAFVPGWSEPGSSTVTTPRRVS